MKRTFKHIIMSILAGAAIFTACQKEDTPDTPSGGEKSKERSILSIAFEGQIGEAVIENTDATSGTVSVEIATDLVADLTKVKITALTFSYGATSSVAQGETMDLTKAASIVITAESGDTKTYSINVKTFSESFAGCYTIKTSNFVGGLYYPDGFGWGTLEFMTPETKSWCWDTEGYGPEANYDDFFEIVCTKINADGTTEGTCKLYGGADGKHWNCIFAGKQNKENVGQPLDLRKYYRVIPLGESTWKRNYEENTITFTAADGTVTVCQLSTEDIHLGEKSDGTSLDVIADKYILAFSLKEKGVDYDTATDYIYTDYQKFVISPWYFFFIVDKVDEIPADSRTEGSEGEINLDPDTPDIPEGCDLNVGEVYLNEVDCTNKKLEIYNPCDHEIDLARAILMKDGDEGTAWKVPEDNFKIASRGYLVLTLNNDGQAGPTFGVSETEGFVITITTNNGIIDALDNSAALDLTGVTYGRKTDGAGEWVIFSTGTIGDSNAGGVIKEEDKPVEGSNLREGQVYINECDGTNKRFEIYNATGNELDLAGAIFTKDDEDKWTVPAEGFKLPAHGFITIPVKSDGTAGPSFGMSDTKAFKITITTNEGEIDKVEKSADLSIVNCTYGRRSDGGSEWVVFSTGTMGQSNAGGVVRGEEPINSIADLPGHYMVSQLLVQGPLYSGAFVDVKDKNWMWNSSYAKEYDNTLVVELTGATATDASARVVYGAGADEGYWDYILIADKNKLNTGDVDLSYNYAQLPHGESAGQISFADNIVYFTAGGKTSGGKIVLPGGTVTAGSATATIPEKCIGIAFQLTPWPDETAWNEGWAWTDFERFLFHPICYLMIFKQVAY